MVSSLEYVALFAVGSTLYSGLGVLSQLSKEPDGAYAFSMPTVVLIAECCKLVLSFGFLSWQEGGAMGALGVIRRAPLKTWALFSVPSMIYSVGNNLDMLCNQYMDSAMFQVLVQLKILTTAVLWRIAFQTPLEWRKWVALGLLTTGGAAAALPSGALSSGEDGAAQQTMSIKPFGMVLIFCYTMCSGLAGVYTEYIYKVTSFEESIHFQNFTMYTVGVVTNFGFYIYGNQETPLSENFTSILRGYNFFTWCLIGNYAFMGLLTSFIMKFLDNIHKLLMSGASMYVSATLTCLLFGLLPSPQFVLGMVIVSCALATYHWDKLQVLCPSMSKRLEQPMAMQPREVTKICFVVVFLASTLLYFSMGRSSRIVQLRSQYLRSG